MQLWDGSPVTKQIGRCIRKYRYTAVQSDHQENDTRANSHHQENVTQAIVESRHKAVWEELAIAAMSGNTH